MMHMHCSILYVLYRTVYVSLQRSQHSEKCLFNRTKICLQSKARHITSTIQLLNKTPKKLIEAIVWFVWISKQNKTKQLPQPIILARLSASKSLASKDVKAIHQNFQCLLILFNWHNFSSINFYISFYI